MSPNREKRNRIHAEIERLRHPSINDIQWMARRGELLGPHSTPVDDKSVSSRLYGPVTKTVQLERIRVVVGGEDEMEDWHDRTPLN